MSRRQILAAVVLVPFLAFSTVVTLREGFMIYFTAPFTHPIWTQEFLDLCIALSLIVSWIIADGRRRGVRVWPYVVATPLLGSIAPLIYLVLRAPDRTSATAPGGRS
ncbi:MAG: DUF2834 domain-containing protein [Planctomycetes bacterium]|nr:DUF2834 domain-containing protein [Planctomycetota bacterium]